MTDHGPEAGIDLALLATADLVHVYHFFYAPAISSAGKRVTRGAILDANIVV